MGHNRYRSITEPLEGHGVSAVEFFQRFGPVPFEQSQEESIGKQFAVLEWLLVEGSESLV